MRASVQYNDFLGTAAADASDYKSLQDFIQSRGIDTSRYQAVGAKFYAGYSDFFSASIICIDKHMSYSAKPFLVSIGFEAPFEMAEFFDLFKRFEVVITRKHANVDHFDLDDEIYFDDRP